MAKRTLLLAIITTLVIGLALIVSISILPAAPTAPTPTWPMGIDLPDKLPHIPY